MVWRKWPQGSGVGLVVRLIYQLLSFEMESYRTWFTWEGGGVLDGMPSARVGPPLSMALSLFDFSFPKIGSRCG